MDRNSDRLIRAPNLGRLFRLSLVAVPSCYLFAVYFWPVLSLIAFESGLATYREVMSNAFYWQILGNTFLFAAEVTLISLAIGYPIAALACMSSVRIAQVILLCSTIPLWTSVLARTYAWFAIFGRHGLANSLLSQLLSITQPLSLLHTSFAVLVGSAYIMLPLMILTLYPSMRTIDLNTVRAARTLGGSPIQAFIRVFLPLSVPGVISACLLTFIVSLGFFVTPVLLGSPKDRTFAMLIAQQIDTLADFQAAAALSLVLLIPTLFLLFIFGLTVGFEQFVGGRSRVHVRLSRGRGPLISRLIAAIEPGLKFLQWRSSWLAFVGVGLLLLALPYVALIPMSLSPADYLEFPPRSISLRWYEILAKDTRWLSAGVSSLTIALIASALATGIGLMAAVGLREISGRWGRVMIIMFIVPSIIPTMIYSVAAYFVAVKVGVVDRTLGLALAHSTLGLPFVVIICATAIGGISSSIGQAAQSLGARWGTRFRRITFPLIVPSVLTAGLVAFQTSFDEVVVSLFLSGVQTRTLPKAMWQASTLEVTPVIPAVAVVVLLFVSLIAIFAIVASRALRRAG
jgi:putative spermidine/putrescine transport system permease protein